jgi:hypothetical protein
MIASALPVATLQIGLTFSSPVEAHQVSGPDNTQSHRHVYKRNAYGKGATAGHYARPAGSQGIVIWQASPGNNYGKARARLRIPHGHSRQPSQKQMYKQNPVFSKDQSRTPSFNKK